MYSNVNEIVQNSLREGLDKIEKELSSDVLVYYGEIFDLSEVFFRIIEDIACEKRSDTLNVILTTTGGDITAVERHVGIIRHHYKSVHFIVPNYAYSAGTVFCMSGDKILMDYFSILGPIDPQVMNRDRKRVAALGYLDKVNEMIEKSKKFKLTPAELAMIHNLDLADLRGYEQAKELTIDMLKNWLAKYKFKNWCKHKDGTDVAEAEKISRAADIANKLGDNNLWKSHNRPINRDSLAELKLKIDRLEDSPAYEYIRTYHACLGSYVDRQKTFLQTRKFL